MPSDSDSSIELLDQSYSYNDNDQELQNLKNNLIEQIENFKYEILELYEKHEYLQMLDILRIEVESEYVTLKNLKVYCDILFKLAKKFNESKTKKLNLKVEEDLKKLEEKAKTIAGEHWDEKKSAIESNDLMDGLAICAGVLFVIVVIISFMLFLAEASIMVIFGIFFGAAVGISLSIGGIWCGIQALTDWYRGRRIRKIMQKTQEIGKKCQR